VLVRKGIIDDIIVFEDFTRGFTRGKAHFDFIDVGAGKDRADEKIIGESPCSMYIMRALDFILIAC
jgi:hypothetical protein